MASKFETATEPRSSLISLKFWNKIISDLEFYTQPNYHLKYQKYIFDHSKNLSRSYWTICTTFQPNKKKWTNKEGMGYWKQNSQHMRKTKNYKEDDKGKPTTGNQMWKTIDRISVTRKTYSWGPRDQKSLLPSQYLL